MAAPELTDDEKARYDRQLRLWGAGVQAALSASSVLVVGLTGLGAELLKNVALAGVGSLGLLDDGAPPHPGNFIVPADAAAAGAGAAEASAATLAAMNPFVKLRVVAAPPAGAGGLASPSLYAPFSVAVLVGLPAPAAAAAGDACRAAGVKCFAAEARQGGGYLVADLLEHAWRPPAGAGGGGAHAAPTAADAQPPAVAAADAGPAGCGAAGAAGDAGAPPPAAAAPPRLASFVPLSSALSCPWPSLGRRPPAAAVLLRLAAGVEASLGRALAPGDAPALAAAARAAFSAGVPAASVPTDDALRARCEEAWGGAVGDAGEASESPAVAAVLGGILAQEVLKAVSGVGEPANNAFVFDVATGAGTIVRMA